MIAEPARRRHKGKPRAGSARPWWTVAVAVLVALLGAAALVVAGSANQAPPNHFRDARVDASSGHGGA